MADRDGTAPPPPTSAPGNRRCARSRVSWRLAHLLSRKPVRVVTVALANKTARVIWAIMTRGGTYRAPQPAGAVVA